LLRKLRRRFLSAVRKLPILLLLVFAVVGCSRDRPNILLLLSDDQSYPFVGAYGDTNVRTPTLDRLAAEGMRFHRFFTTASQCVPSRASLMTGRSPVATRTTRFTSPLPADEITFPEVLRDKAGYYTGVCGRDFHLDGPMQDDPMDIAALLTQYHLTTFASRVDYLDVSRGAGVEKKVAEFLDHKPHGRPWFLWVNYSNPHYPWDQVEATPDLASVKLQPQWPELPGMREQLAHYCGEVNRLDSQVKAVLDTLKARDALENTLIVFMGDNGGALPHGKGALYDTGVNVPFLMIWPGVIAPDTESRTLLSGEDLAPTLLEAAGLEPLPRMSGVSFLPLLRGEKYKPRKHVFMERGPHGFDAVHTDTTSSSYDLSRAVRTDRYKLIYNCTPWVPYAPIDSAEDIAWTQIKEAHAAGKLSPALASAYFTIPRPVYELYDLDNDPGELENLSGRRELAKVETQLRVALAGKMLRDYDYLPLPDVRTRAAGRGDTSREAAFENLDVNGDGRLTKEEFSADRDASDAEKWFVLRDADGNGFLDHDEYVAEEPRAKR
jgi:arylsulfatase A-like enzyme